MECNKDEAERAKEIAEKKFKLKDIDGAKKFALKAQRLYPQIEGVSQMLATLEVYIAAANKVNGDVNWYGILNASPRDDDETLKRKYRKLALMLHPDKNSSIGAEGAFKHVSEAWKFLSDKEKRAAYDRRRGLQTIYQKVSVSSSNNGFCNFAKPGFTSNVRTAPTQKSNPMTEKVNLQKPVGNTAKTVRPDHLKTRPSSFTTSGSSVQPNTFWTVCRRCMIQYEYLRVYVNCNLLCPNCRQSYSGVEVPKPGMSRCWSRSSSKSAANQNTTPSVFNNSKWTFSRTSSAVHAASVVQQAYEKVKKEREDAKATERREKKNLKRKSTTDLSASGISRVKRRVVIGESEIGCSGGSKVTYYVTGETGKNMGKLHGTEERADKLSPETRKKI